MSSSLLSRVEMAPRDPILGVTEAYNSDANPRKVNLGVGIYYDDRGKVPLLECVREAEEKLTLAAAPRSYLPIDGLAVYDKLVQQLVFGTEHKVITEGRAVTVQTLGGTGGLKIGADFLRRFSPSSEVWISDPSWENHRALFEYAGFTVRNYPYYDAATHGVDFPALRAALECASAGTVIVLHACCHNPSGVDLSAEHWEEVRSIIQRRELIPFLDLAYQGFSQGLEQDAQVVRKFAQEASLLFVSNSFSKSFSLYGERVGALTIVAADKAEADRALSQLKRIVRTNYSNPPTHGAKVVAEVLSSPELRAIWETELAGMRERIKQMRKQLVERLGERVPGKDYSFVQRQNGMFSFSGLPKEAVERLAKEFAVYAIDTGRICVAALNTGNIEYVAGAIAEVLR